MQKITNKLLFKKNKILFFLLFILILNSCKKDDFVGEPFTCSGPDCDLYTVTGTKPEITYIYNNSVSFKSFYKFKKEYRTQEVIVMGHYIPGGLPNYVVIQGDTTIWGYLPLYTINASNSDTLKSNVTLELGKEYSVQTYIKITNGLHKTLYLSEPTYFKL